MARVSHKRPDDADDCISKGLSLSQLPQPLPHSHRCAKPPARHRPAPLRPEPRGPPATGEGRFRVVPRSGFLLGMDDVSQRRVAAIVTRAGVSAGPPREAGAEVVRPGRVAEREGRGSCAVGPLPATGPEVVARPRQPRRCGLSAAPARPWAGRISRGPRGT